MSGRNGDYKAILQDDEDLLIFMRALGDFDQRFTDAICEKRDFTIKLEVRGDCGRLIHAKISGDQFDRPKKVHEEVERRRRLPEPR